MVFVNVPRGEGQNEHYGMEAITYANYVHRGKDGPDLTLRYISLDGRREEKELHFTGAIANTIYAELVRKLFEKKPEKPNGNDEPAKPGMPATTARGFGNVSNPEERK